MSGRDRSLVRHLENATQRSALGEWLLDCRFPPVLSEQICTNPFDQMKAWNCQNLVFSPEVNHYADLTKVIPAAFLFLSLLVSVFVRSGWRNGERFSTKRRFARRGKLFKAKDVRMNHDMNILL